MHRMGWELSNMLTMCPADLATSRYILGCIDLCVRKLPKYLLTHYYSSHEMDMRVDLCETSYAQANAF